MLRTPNIAGKTILKRDVVFGYWLVFTADVPDNLKIGKMGNVEVDSYQKFEKKLINEEELEKIW